MPNTSVGPSSHVSRYAFTISGSRVISSSSLARHISLAHERLKIRPELNPIRRVDVDHLHLSAEALVLQQRVHHDEAVTEDQPIYPFVLILVSLGDGVGEWALGIAEQVEHVRLLPRPSGGS